MVLYDAVVGNPPIVPLIRGLLSCYVCVCILYTSKLLYVKTMSFGPRVESWLTEASHIFEKSPTGEDSKFCVVLGAQCPGILTAGFVVLTLIRRKCTRHSKPRLDKISR